MSIIAAALCCQAQAAKKIEAPRYSVVDLGHLLAREIDEKPGINNAGTVAAWEVVGLNRIRAVSLTSGHVTPLAAETGEKNTFAFDVNDEAAVVGIAESRNDLRDTQAFLWQGNSFQLLPTLGGRHGSAKAINSQGRIAGSSQRADEKVNATVWENGVAKDLGTLPGGDVSRGTAINAVGDIGGESNVTPNGKSQAVIWSKGTVQPLGLLPGGSFSSVLALNDHDEAVGFADSAGGESRAVLWAGGHVTDLGSFGDDPNSALDINNTGQIVGTSAVAEGKMRAFLWEKGQLLDLNDLIPENSGWLLMTAYRITDRGAILVHGFYQGQVHICLLVPVANTDRPAE